MAELLVDHPSGEQMVITIDATGSYFDQTKVLWDTRRDGAMPTVTLGKMQRGGNELVTLPDFLPEHAAAVYAKSFPVEVPITAALEALINAGLYDDIDTYINTLSVVDRVWWQRAEKIHRAFPLVETVRQELNLTNEQIDQLFLAAEQIRKQRAGEI